MNVVVFGGTGNIGGRVAERLRAAGHSVTAVSRETGVDLTTGAGLADLLAGVDVVVDTLNAMAFDTESAVAFFGGTSETILRAEEEARVKHHIALSIVGADRLDASGYLAGKVAQEQAIRESGVPSTIVRATQFFDFLPLIAQMSTSDGVVTVGDHDLQPMAPEEVARVLADVAVGAPLGVVETAGPERASLASFVERLAQHDGSSLPLRVDASVGYFGVPTTGDAIVPVGDARISDVTLEQWWHAHADD
ncbi:SDR family oxidoreductase [Microbacterium sp. RD1]|uniref:SDR family oxidoreductase n=1 Tax=Microbacterium sp. RD1 TaxID=3457313 RepID=UPI003FA5618E